MASYEKRGKAWRAIVTRGEIRLTASFPVKAEAVAWAVAKEAEIRAGKHGAIPDKTFGQLLDRYLDKVSPTKRGEFWEAKRVHALKRSRIASVRLQDLNATHVAEWRDERLQRVSSATVVREWNLLSHACTVAKKEWKWLTHNPFQEVTRPKESEPRKRVFTDDEIDRICFALGVDEIAPPIGISQRVGLVFMFALETACRAGEIVGLAKEDIHPRHIHLPMTKNGAARDVPLSPRAKAILEVVPEGFGVTSEQVDALFRKARDRAGVTGAQFRDSRPTALTRMAKIFTNPLDLAKVSGHKDLRILLNTYYRPSIDDLADKLT